MGKEHCGLRLEVDEILRVDALVGAMSEPGREMTRSKVLRVLVLQALAGAEHAHGVTGGEDKKGGK